MAKKYFSLILVPHCAQRFKTITLSHKAAKTLLVLSIVSVVAIIGFLVDYVTMNVTRAKYRILLNETAEQKKILTDYEESLQKLREKIKAFESYTEKLNVMLGLRSSEVLGELGIGSGEIPSELSGESVSPPQVSLPGNTLQDAQELSQKAKDLEKNLDVLVSVSETRIADLATKPTIWPTIGWVSSPFAERDDPFTGKRTFHYGIDIATNFGNPIVATAEGIVLSVGNDKLSGRNIVIGHGRGLTTHYLHLSKSLVRAGQKVRRGDVIGLVGKTGKALGPHLHYEVRMNNRPQNPYRYILEE